MATRSRASVTRLPCYTAKNQRPDKSGRRSIFGRVVNRHGHDRSLFLKTEFKIPVPHSYSTLHPHLLTLSKSRRNGFAVSGFENIMVSPPDHLYANHETL